MTNSDKSKLPECVWVPAAEDITWNTSCGCRFEVGESEKLTNFNYVYCPNCGKKIKEATDKVGWRQGGR